jgi:YhcH/YjgK/YiaL family protein
MIFDALDHFDDYRGAHSLFTRVAVFLRATDLAALAEGRHEIGRDGCFALVSEYRTLEPGEGFIECHHRYADIQILVRGIERIGVCHRSSCAVTARDEERDFDTLEGEVDWITLRPGSFAVFFPQDGHMPKIRHGAAATAVRKVVIKVPVAG